MASGSRPKRAASSKASARITDQYALNPVDQDEGEGAYEDTAQGGEEEDFDEQPIITKKSKGKGKAKTQPGASGTPAEEETELAEESTNEGTDEQAVKGKKRQAKSGPTQPSAPKRRRRADKDITASEGTFAEPATHPVDEDILNMFDAACRNTGGYRYWSKKIRPYIEQVSPHPKFTPYKEPVDLDNLPIYDHRDWRVVRVNPPKAHKKGDQDVHIRTIDVKDYHHGTTLTMFGPKQHRFRGGQTTHLGGILEAHVCPDDQTAQRIGVHCCTALNRLPVSLADFVEGKRQSSAVRRTVLNYGLLALGSQFDLSTINANYFQIGGDTPIQHHITLVSASMVKVVDDGKNLEIFTSLFLVELDQEAVHGVKISCNPQELDVRKILRDLHPQPTWIHNAVKVEGGDLSTDQETAICALCSFVRRSMFLMAGTSLNLAAFRDKLMEPYMLNKKRTVRGCINGSKFVRFDLTTVSGRPILGPSASTYKATKNSAALLNSVGSFTVYAVSKALVAFIIWLMANAFRLKRGYRAAWEQAHLGNSFLMLRQSPRTTIIDLLVGLATLFGFFVCMSCFLIADVSLMRRHTDGRGLCKYCHEKKGLPSDTFDGLQLTRRLTKAAQDLAKQDMKFVPDIL